LHLVWCDAYNSGQPLSTGSIANCKDLAAHDHNDMIRVGELFQFVAIDVVSKPILKEDLKFLAQRNRPLVKR
jgi:hypothetical protein